MPLLITTAITVSAAQTMLTDSSRRLDLTLESIRRWRLTRGVGSVVVCDGSGYDLGPYINDGLPSPGAAPCEVMRFTNDLAGVRSKGKGYGEGEIVNYALQHSAILKEATCFAKCTGKLWVENFADCIKGFNGLAAFDFVGIFKPQTIDTRFYIVNKAFFVSNMAGLHANVNDAEGLYLEHAFKEGLKMLKYSDYIMVPTPRIGGVSGSTGMAFKAPHSLKAVLRDIRSILVKSFAGYF